VSHAAGLEEADVMLAATLTSNDAAAADWDVLVIGAGPAGAVAAREAARRGARVLLVDRKTFPRGKVCGCCLNGNALAGLAAAGLGDLPRQLGAIPLKFVRITTGGQEVVLSLPGGVSVSREAFDAELVRVAIAAGAAFLPNTTATLSEAISDGQYVRLGDATTKARVVIAATGLHGRFSADEPIVQRGSRIGAGVALDQAPDFYEPGTIYMATGRAGYVGLVRLEDGRLDVAAALDSAAVRNAGGPGAVAAGVLADTGWPAIGGLADVRWKGTPPLTRRPLRLAGKRWFAVGDAAGYVEPFTGEGMAWAVASGLAVAPLAIAAAHGWEDRFIRTWQREHRRVVGRRQWACRVVAAGLRSPRLTRAAVRILARVPAVALPVVRQLYRPTRLSLESSA
jgi:flavin-dependent dehydrogenase